MSTGVTLYELVDLRALLDARLEESEGELTPALEAELDALAGAIQEKAERIALFVREQLANADAIDAEIHRLAARKKAHERAAEGLKRYLKTQLERLGMTKVTGLLATVAIQRNSQPAIRTALEAKDLWETEDARPFVTREEIVVFNLDRAAVIAAWKAKTPLPSTIEVDLGTHVRIR